MYSSLRSLPDSQGVQIDSRSQRVRRQCRCLKRARPIGAGSGLGFRVLAGEGCALLWQQHLGCSTPKETMKLISGSVSRVCLMMSCVSLVAGIVLILLGGCGGILITLLNLGLVN